MRGINIGQTSVGKNMVRLIKPPSPIWRTFLDNHLKSFVSVDFFTVPTIGFQVLYVFLVLAHDRRRIFHFNGTAHPTAEWTGQQLLKTFPFDRVTRNLLRDSDGIFGSDLSGFGGSRMCSQRPGRAGSDGLQRSFAPSDAVFLFRVLSRRKNALVLLQ